MSADSKPRRRRRAPSTVTLQACTACQSARAKCDGVKPDPCSRCTSRRSECQYTSNRRAQKAVLLQEMDSIRASYIEVKNKNLELMHSLDCCHRPNNEAGTLIKSEEACKPDFTQFPLSAEPQPHITVSPQMENDTIPTTEGIGIRYGSLECLEGPADLRQWTHVSDSPALMNHLFDLYFAWVHPVHMLFDESNFRIGYRERRETYCSAALVNAICAMACNLIGCTTPYKQGKEKIRRAELGAEFAAEARSQLKIESNTPLTSIQAFTVMYLVDLCSGKARNASGYLKCAGDLLSVKRFAKDKEQPLGLSMLGIHALSCAWSAMTYQLPCNLDSLQMSVIDEQAKNDMTSAGRRCMPGPQNEGDETGSPIHGVDTAQQQASLSQIIHDTVSLHCGYHGVVTAREMIGCYKRFLNWKNDLPKPVGDTQTDHQPLPHVLSLHIQYHAAIVRLLAPLLSCQHFAAPDEKNIKDMIVYHGRCGLDNMYISRQLYSRRYTMPHIIFSMLHLGDAVVRFSSRPAEVSDVVSFCLQTLEQNRARFPLYGPLQQTFGRMVEEQGLELSTDADHQVHQCPQYGVDEVLDACMGLSYVQPIDQICQYIDHSIGEEWSREWQKQILETRTLAPVNTVLGLHFILND